ncbi:MAG TPA: TIGR03667 family PPOX class F420-dependent oxidoreductase [Acidimicrobiales bacterium]|nr:TIGR03667 family PPOX class F420-dependent oxidoreductase [Acidimicrobiales bacterium]
MTDTLRAASDRLSTEPIGWLTTVSRSGQPQASPIWFLWHDDHIWLRSQAAAGKVANVRANPKVAFHLDDDGSGGDVVTVEGTAEFVEEFPAPVMDAYREKYGKAIEQLLHSTPEKLAADYPISIRITPRRARAW